MTLYSRYLCLPDWCNPDEAASFLGVSKSRVYKMLEDGCFPHSWRSHPRGHWSIPKEDLAGVIGLRLDEIEAEYHE